MNYRISAIVTAFIVMFFVHSASAMNMKDGQWEITTKMEMPGMPMEMPPFKYTQCLTSKDNVPQDKGPDKERNKDCKIKNTEISGNTVTWEVLCISDGKPVKSIGQITYKGDSFDGESKTEMDGMNMVQKMSGRRIGNCK